MFASEFIARSPMYGVRSTVSLLSAFKVRRRDRELADAEVKLLHQTDDATEPVMPALIDHRTAAEPAPERRHISIEADFGHMAFKLLDGDLNASPRNGGSSDIWRWGVRRSFHRSDRPRRRSRNRQKMCVRCGDAQSDPHSTSMPSPPISTRRPPTSARVRSPTCRACASALASMH